MDEKTKAPKKKVKVILRPSPLSLKILLIVLISTLQPSQDKRVAVASGTQIQTPAPTQAPTEVPTVSANTVLYYNPDGGSYYHASENCSRVAAEYLPLSPFYFSDLNSTKYKNLLACNKCDAPARPVITGY